MLRVPKPLPCDHDRRGRYCSRCGLEIDPPPLTFRTMGTEFVASWLQRGFRATAFGLLLAPGHQIRHYLLENRNLLVKPVNYLLVMSAFHYWVLSLYGQAGGGIDPAALGLSDVGPQARAAVEGVRWLYANFYQMALLQAAVTALLLRYVFFREERWTLPEYTIAMTYIMAENLLIQSVLALCFTPFHRVPWGSLQFVGGAGFTLFATAHFLEVKSVACWLRVALAQMLAAIAGVAALIGAILAFESWAGSL